MGEGSCWLRSVVKEGFCGLSWEDARSCAAAALRPRKRGYWREYWSWWGYRDAGHRRFRVVYRGQRISGISLARRKPGVQIPSPPPRNSPGHRPGGSLPLGRRRSRSPCRAANGQQPPTKRPSLLDRGHDYVVKRDRLPTFRLRDGCSASAWTEAVGSSLLTLDALSVQTAPNGSRRIVWMIIGMIKAHPTGDGEHVAMRKAAGRGHARCRATRA
jgi:hypothetical protein